MITQDGLTAAHLQLNRDQILNATAICLRRDGYDAATIRRIAGELSRSVGSIYRYFQDKRDLLFTVAQGALEPVARLAESGADLDSSLRAYHAAAAADPSLYRLMFWLAAMDGRRGDQPGAESNEPPTPNAALPPVVKRIVAAWSIQLGDESAARSCWAVLHGGLALGLDANACLAMVQKCVPQVHKILASTEPMAATEPAQPPRATPVEQRPRITVVPSTPAQEAQPIIHVHEDLVPALAGNAVTAEACAV